ncbi:hypothetical protein PHMEG_00022282 [Phytophthora megakarya]|uniref:Uncharacterized protein n=1 Tax=Phytophthora megakarya TaxID=4795 RepID=A0A225VM46_9STRA|nr:hypothetical protein PHMEG_00022282 [Phytophthora megakarya]
MPNCKQAGIVLSGTPVFMDRGKAGISAGATLGLQLHFCTRHVAGNTKRKFKDRFTSDLECTLYEIQRAENSGGVRGHSCCIRCCWQY